jgi:hypothetical protein
MLREIEELGFGLREEGRGSGDSRESPNREAGRPTARWEEMAALSFFRLSGFAFPRFFVCAFRG